MLHDPVLKFRYTIWLRAVGLYVLCFTVLAALIFSAPGFLGTDDYYHARIATEFIRQGRLALDFPWLPLTLLSPDRFVDHHLLFHLYLAPWTHLAGVTRAKLATVSIVAGVFLSAWVLLRQIRVSYAALWTLLLFGLSVPFLHRILMIRTQGASLLFLVLALILLFGQRHHWLVLLAFAYVWLYNGFVLLLGISVLYVVGAWIAERRLEWKPLIFTALGLALGLIVNPYFPQNILFITEHLGAKVDLESSVRVGSEWYPYNTSVLIVNSGGALLALVIGVLKPSFNGPRRDKIETTLLLVALLTLFMVLRSRRFIEYFPAFSLLFCAAAWGRGNALHWLPANRPSRLLAAAALFSFLLLSVGLTLSGAYQEAQDARPPQYYAGAADWLEENTPAGSVIFQTDWDDFTRLFYHNTHNIYLVGLDPTYLQCANPELWNEWVDITQGRVSQPSQAIQSRFGAQYVVSDTRHDDFEDQARNDPNMEMVYQDRYNYIWRINTPTTILSTP